MNLGFAEILMILGIVLLLFGPSRLPSLGKSLGEAIRGFKKGVGDDTRDVTAERGPVGHTQVGYTAPHQIPSGSATSSSPLQQNGVHQNPSSVASQTPPPNA